MWLVVVEHDRVDVSSPAKFLRDGRPVTTLLVVNDALESPGSDVLVEENRHEPPQRQLPCDAEGAAGCSHGRSVDFDRESIEEVEELLAA